MSSMHVTSLVSAGASPPKASQEEPVDPGLQTASHGEPIHPFTELLSLHTSRTGDRHGSAKTPPRPGNRTRQPKEEPKSQTPASAAPLPLDVPAVAPVDTAAKLPGRASGSLQANAETRGTHESLKPIAHGAMPIHPGEAPHPVSDTGAASAHDAASNHPQQPSHSTTPKDASVEAKEHQNAVAEPAGPAVQRAPVTTSTYPSAPASVPRHNISAFDKSGDATKESPLSSAELSSVQGNGKSKASGALPIQDEPGPAAKEPKDGRAPNSQSRGEIPPVAQMTATIPEFTAKAAPSSLASAAFAPQANPINLKSLSEAISRPLSNGNGTYTVVIAMHPSELGQLQAVVSLDHDGLRVLITPQTQVGHTALSTSVDALKSQLAQGGINVSVTLRDPGSQPRGDMWRQPAQAGSEPAATQASPAIGSITAAPGQGQIHLML